jgi:ribonuclease III
MSNKLPIISKPLLETALTHRSALNEPSSGTTSTVHNERLEFLGDAVLELVVSRFLFDQFPQEPEGKLTAYRSSLVKTETLSEVAQELGLGQKIYMSHGEEAGGGRINPGLLANTMEAVIGAIYLDQGLAQARLFIKQNIIPKLDEIRQKRLYKDAKSQLQEIVQAVGQPTPEYEVVKSVGKDHDKTFTVAVKIEDKVLGQGKGSSKQQAQQAAAAQALIEFEKSR